MRRLRIGLLLIGMCALVWVNLGAGDSSPQLLRITPSTVDGVLVCRLQTSGLPGEKQLQSMHSGLISAIDLDLALVGENEKLLSGNSLSLRFGFDLWEEVYSVNQDGSERRFESLVEMQNYLQDLQGIPVSSNHHLATGERYRIRVHLSVHPIAPDEQDRVEDVIAGKQRPQAGGSDQQEASVSLGRLIRLFYKGGRQGRDGQELMSSWFIPGELQNETH